MAQTKIAVLGGRGKIGQIIVSGLCADKDLQIVILTSREPPSSGDQNGKITYLQTDYSNDSQLAENLRGCNVAIICLSEESGQLFKLSKAAMDAALKAEVEHVILSDYDGDFNAPNTSELLVYEEKIKVRSYAEDLASKKKLNWSSVTSGSIMELGLGSDFLGFDNGKRTVYLIDQGTNAFPCTSSRTLSAAVIALVKQRSTFNNRTAYIADAFTTQQQLQRLFDKYTTASAWKEVNLVSNDLLKDGLQELATNPYEGFKKVIWSTILGQQPRYEGLSSWQQRSVEDMRALNVQPDPTALEQVISQVVQGTKLF